jgi:hypothetical protein
MARLAFDCPAALPVMCFDRFAIVEAHYWFAAHYHDGQFSDLYARLSRISRYFNPGMMHNGPATVEACRIYNALELKNGYKRTHYKVLPSGGARLV